MGGGGVRRTQYRWNWEWGIKGGGGRHNIGGWVGVGAWGRGHAVLVELGGGGGGDRRDATHAMPVERGGGAGG